MRSNDVRTTAAKLKQRYPRFANETDEDIVAAAKELGLVKNSQDNEITLPPMPKVPDVITAADHSYDLMKEYHSGKGWFFVKGQENRAKFAQYLAEQQQHLFALQKAANATEAEAYLRRHNLWTLEIKAVLEGEQAKTSLMGQQVQRTQIENTILVNQSATDKGLPVHVFLTDVEKKTANDEALRFKEKEQQIEFLNHKQREKLKVQLAVHEYNQKAEIVGKLGAAQAEERRHDRKELDGFYVELDELESGLGNMSSSLRKKRIAIVELEIARLEAKLRGLGPTAQENRAPETGQNNGGGNPPAQPGQSSPPQPGPGDQQVPSASSRHIN